MRELRQHQLRFDQITAAPVSLWERRFVFENRESVSDIDVVAAPGQLITDDSGDCRQLRGQGSIAYAVRFFACRNGTTSKQAKRVIEAFQVIDVQRTPILNRGYSLSASGNGVPEDS